MITETRFRRLERTVKALRPLALRLYNREYRVGRSIREGRKDYARYTAEITATLKRHSRIAKSLAGALGMAKRKGKVPVFLTRAEAHKLRMYLVRDNRRPIR